jgi:3-deoxy-D-manno-octulosonic-acid transferase
VSNKESEGFLKILGAKNIKNYGNLKFTKNKTELNNKLDSDFLNKIQNRKIWCGASTHPTEEILCAKSHLKIKERYKNILTIIIPRHIDRVKTIYEELSKLDLKIVVSSNLSQVDNETDIILVDSYGESLKFYNISKHVFLGKSLTTALTKDSGQNPIEPARLGCKIFHGPYVSNFAEIYKYLNELGISKEVNNSNELSLSLVEEFKDNKPKNPEITAKIETHGENILNNVTMEIKKYI